MFTLSVSVVFLLAAISCYLGWGKNINLYRNVRDSHGDRSEEVSFRFRGVITGVLVGCAMFSAASTSFFYVDKGNVAVLYKVYGTGVLTEGRIIAVDGEKGPQADIYPDGFHTGLFVTVLNEVKDDMPLVLIPPGFYGEITALDGKQLPEDNIMAPKWKTSVETEMLDAKFFLKNGGFKGVQATVLKPGLHRLNLALFNVNYGDGKNFQVTFDAKDGEKKYYPVKGNFVPLDTRVTVIPKGYVGVVRSNIEELPHDQCVATAVKVDTAVVKGDETDVAEYDAALTAPLVPNNCRGIWSTALLPGDIFVNRRAYVITNVPTRVQSWVYKGGYTKRSIALTLQADGKFSQKLSEVVQEYDPTSHADKAITVRVEGWEVPQDVRVIVQIDAQNAPVVVASVGGLQQLEDKIITPAIRSIVRNVVGGMIETVDAKGKTIVRSTEVMDLINNRQRLEQQVAKKVRVVGANAGLNVKSVKFGEPAVPPELLIPAQREQLSVSLKAAYAEEEKAQKARIDVEKTRALADQQSTLVEAQIADQSAKFFADAAQKQGDGEKRKLQEIAIGQKAQLEVLGKDNTMQLAVLGQLLETISKNPGILKGINVPSTVVLGGGGGLEGFGAVLGNALNPNAKKK
jgi:hypothetical protein